DWHYAHPSDIMDESAFLCPLFSGVSYELLEGYRSLQWPVAADGTETPLLYVDGFPVADNKARLYPLVFELVYESADEFDLHFNNGRVLEHFHEGNMTYKSPGLTHELPNAFLEISPELAEARGVEEGATVKLISRSGEVTVDVH